MKLRSSLLAGGLAATFVVTSCGGGGGSTKVGFVGQGPATTVEPAAGSRRVGDVIRVGETEVVAHKFTDPYDAGLQKPAPGTHYVAVDVELKNASGVPQVFSSAGQFEMKNVKGKRFSPIGVPGTGQSVGGRLEPGASRRGLVAFQIPDDSQGLLLVFIDRILAKGSASIYLA